MSCPVCGGPWAAGLSDDQKREMLGLMLEMIYLPEGVTLWLAEAERRGWSLDEQLQRAEQLATGAFV